MGTDTIYSPLGSDISTGEIQAGAVTVAKLGSGISKLIGETTIAGAAVTTMQVASLDLATHKRYLVVGRFNNADGLTKNFGLNFNGDTTATNYYCERISAAATTIGTGNNNEARLWPTITTGADVNFALIVELDVTGRARANILSSSCYATTALAFKGGAFYWITAANVTSIEIVGETANSIAIGSRLAVYALG